MNQGKKADADNIARLPKQDARGARHALPSERPVVKRNVAIIMPFGAANRVTERANILDLMRIKYIVEQLVRIPPAGSSPDAPAIKHEVSVFREPVGTIPEDAVDTLAHADAVVALLTKGNINVIYELAIRNLLKDEPILVLQGKPEEVLPVYLKDMAYIPYQHHKSSKVIKQIKDTAKAGYPELDWNRPDQLPPGLKEAIDASDHLKTELQKSLRNLEENPQRPPHFLRKHTIDLDPGHVLLSWTTYAPFSVVRIKWLRKRPATKDAAAHYDPSDMVGPPVVYAANKDYLALFGLRLNPFPDPDSEDALTVQDMLLRLKRYMDPDGYKKFVDDQDRLINEIIFNDGVAQARVSIRLDDRHPLYPNEVFLPNLLGKRVVGSTRSPHIVFLAIAFLKDFEARGDTIENVNRESADAEG